MKHKFDIDQYDLYEFQKPKNRTRIRLNEIAGKYFAGIYCQRCWDVKHKAIEAKESYD